jgi:hypothetical protein
MTQNTSYPSKTAILILILSIMVPVIWYTSQHIDVYRVAFIGAIAEMIWLPMFALLFGLPIVSLLFWRRNKFAIRSLYFYSFLISVAGLLLFIAAL